MHPLRVTLLISLAIATAVAAAFGFALYRLGVGDGAVILLSVVVFVAFVVPWAAVFLWALRWGKDLMVLTERTVGVAEGGYGGAKITDRAFHEELDELARAIEELREQLARQAALLDERRQTTRRIIDSFGDGLIALTRGGRVAMANARVAELFGSKGELEGKQVLEVARKQSIAEGLERALQGETFVARITAGPAGAERQVEMRIFPVPGSGEVSAIALFIDITEIERLQRIRREFLDDFSHEVRTPLAGLRSAVESFERELSEEQEKQLRAIMLRQLERIERLVQDLSELNQIESGDVVLQRRDIDLQLVASDLVEEFRGRSAGEVRFVLRGEATFARVDPSRVQQILTNLIDNACKHGGAQGEIVVEVFAEADDAVVRVSDSGAGIPPEDIERIFHRFYRVDRSRSQQVPGTGLGLAIAKHLVAGHGGGIRAFNRAGGGATFEVRFPRPKAADRREPQ